MTKFIHTIKDSEPVKTDDTVAIEWSLEVEHKKVCLMGNKPGSSRFYMVTVTDEGVTTILNGFRILGLPQPALLGD